MSLNHLPLPLRTIWNGIGQRIGEILLDAPWSSFDLLASLIIGALGVYFLLPFSTYILYPIYSALSLIASERVLGSLFLLAGIQSLLITIYCERPPFVARLCARVAMTLCFVILLGNSLLLVPPPPSTTVWFLLFMASLWGVIRTHQHGY